MKPFTLRETVVVTFILIFIAGITFYNLNISLRRARDAQRRADIGNIANALNKYRDDFGFFPPAKDGKIVACKGGNFDSEMEEIKNDIKFDRDKFFALLVPCEWGKDSLRDVTDENYEAYMSIIYQDPKSSEGKTYLYLSNPSRFQIFSYMEGGDEEIGYDTGIVRRNLECGAGFVCSFGKSHASPLEKSIEDYEKELLEKAKIGQ